jgi:DNA-binding transcriptional regulator GbsR (MarR family)
MKAVLRAVPNTAEFILPVAEDLDEPLESGIQALFPNGLDFGIDPELLRVQGQFIECWGRMASAFAMDRTMGRVHALIYVHGAPIDVQMIALRLATTPAALTEQLRRLIEWGLIRGVHSADGRVEFVAEPDPWSWFLRTIRERHTREFAPLYGSAKAALVSARELAQRSRHPGALATFERVERFTKFIEEFSRLIEAFVTLGAKPMAAVLKMIAKLMPRASAF